MSSPPSGTVTFLFTDIEGSTKLAREHPGTWDAAQARHHALLRNAIECHQGYVFQIIGDAFCAAFHTAGDALQAAVKSQIDLGSEDWGQTPIKVRMGIHTGKAESRENGEYQGYLAMSRVQRLMSAGHGGQVLISAASQELLLEDLPENISLRDLGERRLKDLIRPEHIYQLVIPDLSVDFPPLKTLDLYRHNLPVQLTSFIGRQKEMEEIKQAIPVHRLVTLTGVGGTGKTRLSLQVAADLLDQFPDGIWFVELASLNNPELIGQTILRSIGISEQPGVCLEQQLTDYVRERRLLLILDNCEHLLEACAALVNALLSQCHALFVLATSREALGISGEMIWHVPSLSLPDIKQLPAIEQLSQYEAVQLFIERAALAQPHFQVTRDNAPAIAQICSRLDGIPLAIELAAARVRTMGVGQINEKLNDRFRLLTGGSRTALERHQTLRATIDWSYNLLSPDEKLLLCQLSVFIGTWDLEAAEQVCTGRNNSNDVLDLLSRLVEKSLVMMDEFGINHRYHLLETTRQYARDKLFDREDMKQLRDRHLVYYQQFAERVEQEIRGPSQVDWIHRLKLDDDNLRIALDWCVSEEYTEPALRLLGTWDRTGELRFSEMYKWFVKVCALPGVTDHPAPYASLLNEMAHDYWSTRNVRDAKALAEEARKIWLTLGAEGELGLAKACGVLGLAELSLEEDLETAQSLLEQSLVLYQRHGNKRNFAVAMYRLGHLDWHSGHYAAAEEKYLKSQAIWKEIGDEYSARIVSNELGTTAQWLGDYERAAMFYEECVKADHEFHGSVSPVSLMNSAWALLHLGDTHKAKERFLEALELSKGNGDNNGMLLCLAGIASLLQFTGGDKEAARLFGAFDRLSKASGIFFDPTDRREIDYYLVPVRAHLEDARYAKAWADGSDMNLEQAIACALEKTHD